MKQSLSYPSVALPHPSLSTPLSVSLISSLDCTPSSHSPYSFHYPSHTFPHIPTTAVQSRNDSLGRPATNRCHWHILVQSWPVNHIQKRQTQFISRYLRNCEGWYQCPLWTWRKSSFNCQLSVSLFTHTHTHTVLLLSCSSCLGIIMVSICTLATTHSHANTYTIVPVHTGSPQWDPNQTQPSHLPHYIPTFFWFFFGGGHIRFLSIRARVLPLRGIRVKSFNKATLGPACCCAIPSKASINCLIKVRLRQCHLCKCVCVDKCHCLPSVALMLLNNVKSFNETMIHLS